MSGNFTAQGAEGQTGIAQMCAAVCVYSVPDLPRQQLIMAVGSWIEPGTALQTHSVNDGELIKAVQRWDL